MVTDYAEITKDVATLGAPPNLADYDALCAGWNWDDVIAELDLPGGSYNLAHECIDRHANGALANKIAMIYESTDGEVTNYTFADMQREANKWANAITALGIEKADRVFFFTDRIPELYFAIFGDPQARCDRRAAVRGVRPDAVAERMRRAEGVMVVTTPNLLPKIDEIRGDLPSLEHVVVIGHRQGVAAGEGNLDYLEMTERAATEFENEPTGPEDWSVMHFTSGTTGLPKGAAHVHNAVIGHYATGKYVIDLQPDDVYWCTADPGWVTGTSYHMFAPWSNGVTNVVYEGGFSARRWYEAVERHKVTVWYTAPTAIRMLMKAGVDAAHRGDLSSLRYVMSVGEPLNPEGVLWGQEAFELPIHDNWWQTETGAIMIANYPSLPIRPGSMGKPFPGIEPAIIDDNFEEITEPDREGQLALKPGWPSMFRTYWNDQERYDSRFQGGWYITGDRAGRTPTATTGLSGATTT